MCFVLNLTQLTIWGDMKSYPLAAVIILIAFAVPTNVIAGQSGSPEYTRANRMYVEGKYSDALRAFQQLLTRHSGDIAIGDVHARLGDCYFQLHDYRNALNAYRTAIGSQNNSQKPATQYWIGFCVLLLGNNKEAVVEFLKIPDLYPSSGMWVGTAYYWAGMASERMGQRVQAADYYRKAAGNGKSTQGQYALKRADAVHQGENK